MSKIIRLIDRTRTVQDWKCPRSRYWGYEYMGRGIVKRGTSLELFTGITVHDALAMLASLTSRGFDVDIDTIAEAAYKQVHDNIIESAGEPALPENLEFAKEQGTLVEGLIRGFHKHVWPRLMADYKIVAIEQEMEYKLDPCQTCSGLGYVNFPDDGGHMASEGCTACAGRGCSFIFMAKPDLIVEDKEGDLIYLEYKTTSSKKDNWINSWETAVQLHSSILATEQTLGKRPTAVQIVGLYKGYESYGKQGSPFCYAYKKFGNPPFTQDQVQYEFKAGFKRFPTWEMAGGVKAWVESMPDSVLADQFPLTPPIFVNEDLVGKFFAQRLHRERDIANFNEYLGDMDKTFPQHFDQCRPSFGWGCPYTKLCHGQVNDPLAEGYELREPHHAQEREALGLDG